MHYFSMFSGIGGFEYGIDEMGDCVGYSEIDKYAEAIYRYHYPEHKGFGDATGINTDDLPDFDCLVGGFPCQSFSIAGKRGGFSDSRGTLFFEIARICADKRPGYILLENVKGLLSHDNGKTFQSILGILSDIGYLLQWEVCNSKCFGVPQNRERVFIIGHLGNRPRPEVFPIQQSNNRDYQKVSGDTFIRGRNKNTSGCLDTRGVNAFDRSDLDRLIYTYGDNYSVRRLTPLEAERLQAFPDGWTKYGLFDDGIKEISDTQRYNCLGNAVTTSVVKEIMRRLVAQ